MYYSDRHRKVLASCAVKANWILWDRAGLHVNPEELMAEGWWHCLRRCPSENLDPAIGNTIKAMVEYGLSFYLHHSSPPEKELMDPAECELRDYRPSDLEAVDISDEVGFLQDHMDRGQFQLIRNLATGVWSVRQVARQERASKNTVCARAKRGLRVARQLLGANT